MQKQQTNDVRQEKTSAPETETDSGISTTPMPSPTPMPTINPNGLKELVEVSQQEAELGNTKAMTYLGRLYQSGNGVDQSYEKAAELYKKAADLGNSETMTSLGLCISMGMEFQRTMKSRGTVSEDGGFRKFRCNDQSGRAV